MGDTTTLSTTSSKPEEKKTVPPWQQLGPSFEFDGLIDKGGEFIKQGAQDFLSSTFELIKGDIGGTSEKRPDFSATGSLENNYREPKAEVVEAEHKRIIYSTLEEGRRNAQKFAHEASLDMEVKLDVAGMNSDDRKAKLHVSRDLDDKHIDSNYHRAILYIEAKNERKKAKEAVIEQSAAEVQGPRGPDFAKNKAIELGPTSIYNAAG